MGGQHPGLGAQGEGTAGGVLERGDTQHTWAPNGGGAGAPKEPGNRLWKVLWGFFPQLIMVKVVVFRGKFLFQTLGIWTVTFLGNSVIPAFL